MKLLDNVTLGQPLITFSRMLIIVIIGLMTIYFDGGLMGKRGLQRESFWAKILGCIVIIGGIGGWIICLIWG